MMNILDILLLSVALAMDCFTVSMVSGAILRRLQWKVILRLSLLFGLFQAAMPYAGWLATKRLSAYIEAYDHWIAFLLLAFLGGKMIREAFLPEEERHFDPRHLRTQLLLAVATSIDALAVGISLAVTGYQSWETMLLPLTAIGLTSFLFGLIGHLLGVHAGRSLSRRLKPELLGGIILVLIGIKVLVSHLAASSL